MQVDRFEVEINEIESVSWRGVNILNILISEEEQHAGQCRMHLWFI